MHLRIHRFVDPLASQSDLQQRDGVSETVWNRMLQMFRPDQMHSDLRRCHKGQASTRMGGSFIGLLSPSYLSFCASLFFFALNKLLVQGFGHYGGASGQVGISASEAQPARPNFETKM